MGLGDRHGENMLFDASSGDVVHVDFSCLFDKVWGGLPQDAACARSCRHLTRSGALQTLWQITRLLHVTLEDINSDYCLTDLHKTICACAQPSLV